MLCLHFGDWFRAICKQVASPEGFRMKIFLWQECGVNRMEQFFVGLRRKISLRGLIYAYAYDNLEACVDWRI